MKRAWRRHSIGLVLVVMWLAFVWACSNAAQYGGGGRDIGPQGMPMGTTSEGGGDAADSGVDTGVDTGVPMDTGTGG